VQETAMISHPYFDLYLHTDDELSELLGGALAARETLHEWPLSCVQRVTLASGESLIYKAESGPTVEAEFYAAARSPVMLEALTLYRDQRYTCLSIAEANGKSLEQITLSEPSAILLGRAVLSEIAAIEGDVPVYLDVSTWERWQALMSGMLDDLSGLLASHRFTVTRPDDLDALAQAAFSAQVREAYAAAADAGLIGLLHHDLKADNVFINPVWDSPDSDPEEPILQFETRIIDWQYPQRGLVEIDLTELLASLGYDPRPLVHPGVIIAADLLRAHWFCECSTTWFPPGIEVYDPTIAAIAKRL